jgi:hypothetical protein
MKWHARWGGWLGCLVGIVSPAWAGEYREPHFDHPLFAVGDLGLEETETARLAGELVKAAYYLWDQPGPAAKAVAVAHALVPRHSGARVANFRLRSGKAPDEATLIDPDEVARLLAETAERLRADHPAGAADQAVACLVEVALALPVADPSLRKRLEALGLAAGAADWGAAFP